MQASDTTTNNVSGGFTMWRGFEAAMLDETVTWQGIRESLRAPRTVLGVLLTLAGLALVVHYLA